MSAGTPNHAPPPCRYFVRPLDTITSNDVPKFIAVPNSLCPDQKTWVTSLPCLSCLRIPLPISVILGRCWTVAIDESRSQSEHSSELSELWKGIKCGLATC